MKRGCLPTLFLLLLAVPAGSRAATVDYLRDVKPLLQERCYSCHGALKQKKELRLDTVAAMLKGSSDGPVIQRGEPNQSRIIKRVTATDLEVRMPPEHEGEPFTAAQVKLLSDWIAAGAPAPADEKGESDPKEHWAFRPCRRPRVPVVANSAWVKNPIDAFIAQRHAQHGLAPRPEAPREVLQRRLYLDLIGLPPTAAEITAASEDLSNDWYEKAVQRLLNDPRHGERWARHWMDVWRYSDWWGLGDQLRNSQKHIWHWRDWIIESLNADTPYDEMVRLMLAADELHPNDLDKLRATGFLARNWFLFNRNQWLEETVEHVSKGLLGLTMNCAKCHDHKYDPIRQADFYQMRAFFEPYHVRLDVVPGEADLAKDGIPRIFDGQLDTPTYRFVRGQESQPDKSAIIVPGVPALLAFKELSIQPVSLPVEAYQPERRAWVIETYLRPARRKLETAEAPIAKLRQALASALRQEANLLSSSDPEKAPTNTQSSTPSALTRDQARIAVEEARGALNVAESTLAFAKADLASLERRAEATRASWTKADKKGDDAALMAKTVAAVKAERDALSAKARLTLAEAERRRQRAGSDKRDSIEKEIRQAREALEKAIKTAEAPVKPEDQFTQLAGAQWTPTRFFNSTADDPTVKFAPQSSGRRKALAEWITDRRHPLTARVAANHIWTRHFGTPLVSTIFDFGRKGAAPTHPELLDWLAAELMESGWSMKHLHRLIVTSSAYRMSSSVAEVRPSSGAEAGERPAEQRILSALEDTPVAATGDGRTPVSRSGIQANVANDPENLYLWRRNPIRLEAEAVRDSILSLAGTLDSTIGGPPVPSGNQEDSKRRSLYFFHSNNDRNLFLTTFDEAGVKECYRRDQSIVPQQAMALTNSKLVLDSASRIAARLSRASEPDQSSSDDVAFIRRAFLEVLAIAASDAEVDACGKALENWRQDKSQSAGPLDPARAHLIWALLNHNDFVTLR
ncbi:MAG: DUF1553 domain-containing protein [Verrucomicrobia bacterium]|nr:DUF1553 domain-containing protein [Verrucomicrobiota bacterium]